MNIFITNAHWNNRGDEAANRAMIDAIKKEYPKAKISIQIMSKKVEQFPYKKEEVKHILSFPRKYNLLEIPFLILSKGRIFWKKNTKEFIQNIKEADIVIHSPGGPSIGDIYMNVEWLYLIRLLLAVWYGKKIFFYAPSMGPFNNGFRNKIRKYILQRAEFISLREPVSKKYLENLNINKDVKVTLDSAIQNDIDQIKYGKMFKAYAELNEFLNETKKVIGITVTDLQWNPKYAGNRELKDNINGTFEKFLNNVINKGYKILFVPQLFGEQNDYKYMNTFKEKLKTDNIFVMSDNYDCYFQQYVISKLKAVVGMRYHSNIFSAKMEIPFISISYEQKMKGFMKKVNLQEYCINVETLNINLLINTFEKLENNYEEYKGYLKEISKNIKKESAKTTEYLFNIINNNKLK